MESGEDSYKYYMQYLYGTRDIDKLIAEHQKREEDLKRRQTKKGKFKSKLKKKPPLHNSVGYEEDK